MKTIEVFAEVSETGPDYVRLRIGADGHQHRIMFNVPDPIPFAKAAMRGQKVRVTIEIPEE